MTLQEKKLAIIAEIGDVPKTGYNSNQNYSYYKEGDILGAIKPLLMKYKVTITPSLSWDHGPAIMKEGNLTTVNTKYTITDVETGESEVQYWGGQGADNQDKGMNKAFTAAMKYFLIKYFMLEADEEDADGASITATPPRPVARPTAPAPKQPAAPPTPAPQAPPAPTASGTMVACEACGQLKVPPGVANFSKNNFNGHIYCMPCQKQQVRGE